MSRLLTMEESLMPGDKVSGSLSEDVRFGARKVYVSVRADVEALPEEEATHVLQRLESVLVHAREKLIDSIEGERV